MFVLADLEGVSEVHEARVVASTHLPHSVSLLPTLGRRCYFLVMSIRMFNGTSATPAVAYSARLS